MWNGDCSEATWWVDLGEQGHPGLGNSVAQPSVGGGRDWAPLVSRLAQKSAPVCHFSSSCPLQGTLLMSACLSVRGPLSS